MKSDPKIEMCWDEECPSRMTCSRHPDSGVVEVEDQQWFEHLCRSSSADDCVFFIPIGVVRASKKEVGGLR